MSLGSSYFVFWESSDWGELYSLRRMRRSFSGIWFTNTRQLQEEVVSPKCSLVLGKRFGFRVQGYRVGTSVAWVLNEGLVVGNRD